MLTSPQDHWRIKRKNGIWSEKAERKKIGPIREGEKTKKNLFGNKNFHKTLVVGGGGSLEGGRLVGGRLGQRSRLERLGG